MHANNAGYARFYRRLYYAIVALVLAVLAVGILGGGSAGSPAADGSAPKKVSFLIVMKAQVDTSSARSISDPVARRQAVYRALTEHAVRTQAEVRALLTARGITYRAYYLTSALAVNGDQALRDQMNARSDVAYTLELPNLQPLDTTATPPPLLDEPTGQAEGDIGPVYPVAADALAEAPWGIDYIGARRVWEDLGVTGEGIIVGSADTGVDFSHPVLRANYAGSDNNHDYTWYDPWYGRTTPLDWHGHGTHTNGTAVGQDGIGVAPGATWIGCSSLGMNYGNAAYYMDCMQFLFAPFAHDATAFDGDPARGAHVVNNSWGCPAIERCDMTVLRNALINLANGGQMNVFAAGNSGPTCASIGNPAFNEVVLSIGAINKQGKATGFTSRGPVIIDGSGRIRPDVVAPGAEVYSAFPNGKYSMSQGTSMAAPHITGLVALLWSAEPALIGDLDATMALIRDSAQPVTITDKEACGGTTATPNNVYGYGYASAYEAIQEAQSR
ncbi:MAG: S8 family serine peptidase [Anaerolineae bacterium]|jgi:subtilisin family serine protease|nr:S8 family serine peptidase [Anaerolineae bacterium]